jgi:ATP-dependent DNA ligase
LSTAQTDTLPAGCQECRRRQGAAIVDAEVGVGLIQMALRSALHSRVNDAAPTALAFDISMNNGEDLWKNRLRNARSYCASALAYLAQRSLR